MLQTNPVKNTLVFSVRFGIMKQRTGLKLVSRDQHDHLNVKKERVSITHMAVIKSLSPCSVSTGCLLHLSLIWLRALIWGNRSLTGIQSSLCTRSVAVVETQRLPCARNLGRKRSPTKWACEQTPLLAARSAFLSRGVSSVSLSSQCDKVQRLKSAARNFTCLCK